MVAVLLVVAVAVVVVVVACISVSSCCLRCLDDTDPNSTNSTMAKDSMPCRLRTLRLGSMDSVQPILFGKPAEDREDMKMKDVGVFLCTEGGFVLPGAETSLACPMLVELHVERHPRFGCTKLHTNRGRILLERCSK